MYILEFCAFLQAMCSEKCQFCHLISKATRILADVTDVDSSLDTLRQRFVGFLNINSVRTIWVGASANYVTSMQCAVCLCLM